MSQNTVVSFETLAMAQPLPDSESVDGESLKVIATSTKKRRGTRNKLKLRKSNQELCESNNVNLPTNMLFSLTTLSNEVGNSLARMNLDTDADMDGETFVNSPPFDRDYAPQGSQEVMQHQVKSKSKINRSNNQSSKTGLGNHSPLVLAENYQETFQSHVNHSVINCDRERQVWQPGGHFQCVHQNSPPSSSSKKVKEPRGHKKSIDNLSDSAPSNMSPQSSASSALKKQKKKHISTNTSRTLNTNSDHFNEYLPKEEVNIGLQKQELIEGLVRINPKSFTEAYITAPDGGQDILIEGIKNRNRALEGDEVVVQLNSKEEWKKNETSFQRTGFVVFIHNKVHPRKAIGHLKVMADKNPNVALFSPRDPRVPRIRVPMTCCPPNFLQEHRNYATVLFCAAITEWTDVKYAIGTVLEMVGSVGDIKAENAAILLEYDLKVEPFPLDMRSFFPETPYKILEDEILKREDLRKECIFTIDPATAKDLDDAMSCKELPNGNLEIGVHISDVSFFIKEGTRFDMEVAERGTSTYLVDTVYHMLPRDLCMMCSLLPGEDKLAYSVFWEIDQEGSILSHRFTRSVINSCAQLAYEHAQIMLENPDKKWTVDEVPPVHGKFSVYDLSRVVNHLHRISTIFRCKRFSDGALRIDQPKLVFSLDRATGLPLSFSVYVNKESHRLIEEFMLLANMTVAKRIHEDFPKCAFLRSHHPPLPYLMEQMQKLMERYGVHLDVSSAGSLQQSLKNYVGDDFLSEARMMVLYSRCAKPMSRAKYFCANGVDEADFWHYALNVPLYTHFTSPIRRYPDIMVHRLLSASLGYCNAPSWIPDEVHKIAANCNKKKYSAKLAGEKSSDIYLALLIGQQGPLLEMAVTVDVKDRSFDVIICDLGITQRIYTNNLPAEVHHKNQDHISSLEINWLSTAESPAKITQTIELFSVVTVQVKKVENLLKLESALVRPSTNGTISH